MAAPAPPPPMDAPPSPSAGGGGLAVCENATADALHQERMEYIRQLVQEKESLANNPGCDVARRLLEQGTTQKGGRGLGGS